MVGRGIPKEVLRELNIQEKEEEKKSFEVTAIVEKHQIKLPIPPEIRREIEMSKGQKVNLKWDRKTNTLSYQLENA